MGYRSDVVCRVIGDREAILNTIALLRLTHPDQKTLTEVLNDCTLVKLRDNEAMFGWTFNDVKWYDSYSDVQLFEKLWDTFDAKQDEGFIGAFVRIGEEDDDIESRYFGDNGYELASVSRYIDALDFNGPNLLTSTLESSEITQGTT